MSHTPSSDGWPYNCELAPFFQAIKNKEWMGVATYVAAALVVILIFMALFFLVVKFLSFVLLIVTAILLLTLLLIFLFPKKPERKQE